MRPASATAEKPEHTVSGLEAIADIPTISSETAGVCRLTLAASEANVVKHPTVSEIPRTWIVDYSAARARAIQWLGDRYLLAKPINAGENAWRRAPSGTFRPRSSP